MRVTDGRVPTSGWRLAGREWISRSRNRRIFATATLIACLTLLVKVAATAKDISVAFYFGTHGSLDAFLAAFVIPGIAISVIGGAVSAAFIPAFVKAEHAGSREAAHRLFAGVLYWAIVLLCLASAALALLSSPLVRLVAPGFDAPRSELAHRYLLLLLPSVVLGGVSSILASALNAGHRYAAAALAPIVVPLLTAGAVVVYGNRIDAASLCYGTTLGYFVQALALLMVARSHGLPIIPKPMRVTPETMQVFRQFAPAVAGSIVLSGTTLVDQAMASFLAAGSVSTLNYANKVVSVVTGVITMALGTAILPHFSEMVARNDWRGLRQTLRVYTRLLLLVTIPLVAILILGARPLVRLLFQRGAFDAHDVALVAATQSCYLLQVPFFAIGIPLVRLVSSLQRNMILFWGTTISVVLNAILDYVFMQRLGVPGIALATSCVYAVSWAYMRTAAMRVLPRDDAVIQTEAP